MEAKTIASFKSQVSGYRVHNKKEDWSVETERGDGR
jgi:hypothetical protein